MEPSCTTDPLTRIPCLPLRRNKIIEWLGLVYRPSVEAEWLIAARDRAPSHDGGSMWFMLAIGMWVYVRLGGN
jgi:hypothetical protein